MTSIWKGEKEKPKKVTKTDKSFQCLDIENIALVFNPIGKKTIHVVFFGSQILQNYSWNDDMEIGVIAQRKKIKVVLPEG